MILFHSKIFFWTANISKWSQKIIAWQNCLYGPFDIFNIRVKIGYHNDLTYRKVASRSTCYYSENQVFGGATNRDMSLNETCYYSKIQKFWTLKSQLVTCPKGYLFAWILILLCLDFKSFCAWISNPSLLGFHMLLCLD